ncbi:MAG: ABC transporter permease subunit, partial [Phycisphaerae bacterium]|nr:ABC transporter permease subunit [Phycisphaerae bacterium]
FPAPSHVLDALLSLLNIHTALQEPLGRGWPLPPAGPVMGKIHQGPLVQALAVSLWRLAIGFGVSVLLGALLGVLIWRSRFLDELLGPLFLGLQTLPSVCWVPLAVLLFGLRESGILFVVVMGSVFAIAIALRDGMRTIPPILQRAGMMLGATGWRQYAYVLFPASLPALATSLRQGFSFAWRSLMGGELIFALQRQGLGFLLEIGRSFSDVGQVVAVMIVMIVVGMLADQYLFAPLERRVHTRFGLLEAE